MKKRSFFITGAAILFLGGAWQYRLYEQDLWRKVKTDYDRMICQQKRQQQWAQMGQIHPDLIQRLKNIEKTSSLTTDKIHFLLKKMASLHQLTSVTTQCQPCEEKSFQKMKCQFKANSLTDGEIFRFVEALPQEIPNILGVKVGKIQRTSALNPKMLLEISSQKQLSLFSVSLTFDWIYVKKS